MEDISGAPDQDPSFIPTAPTLEDACNRMRAALLAIEQDTRALVTQGKLPSGEPCAQAMLAVRHLEDARMRLGKVIQHTAGSGVSCWDSDRKPVDDGR